jgi:hypothetical protein
MTFRGWPSRLFMALFLVAALSDAAVSQGASANTDKGAPLQSNGDVVSALRTVVSEGFDNLPVRVALTIVAVRARLSLTFDPAIAGMDTRITIAAHDRTASNALLEIARLAHLRINVLPDGQLLVLLPEAPGVVARVAVDTATAMDRAYTLPAMHAEATRVERLAFDEAPNVGMLSVTGRDMSSASHFFAQSDLLRGVQLLPGVEARNDYTSGLNVRGGEADQNLIMLDGYPIYNPFHLGGLFGTFIDPMVGRVDLNTGGFPAQFGGRLSSVLDVKSAEEPRLGLHGTGEVSLISSTLSLGSAVDSGGGNWMVAGRRTYADALVSVLSKGTVPYHFEDAQAHYTHTLPGNARLAFTGYTGLDDISVDNQTDHYSANWGNRLLGGTYAKSFPNGVRLFGHRLGDSARVEQRLSVSHFGIDVNIANNSITASSADDEVRAGGALSSYSATHARSAGYEVSSQYLSYTSSQVIPIFPGSAFSQRNLSGSVYYDDVWRPTHSLIVDAGVRVDALVESRWVGVLPRLSLKYFVNDNLAVTGAFGDYAQWVRSLTRDDIPIRAMDFWIGSDSLRPVSRARHYVLGLERWVTPQRTFRVEGFYKIYRDLLEPNPLDDPNRAGDEFLPVAGRAYGADLLVRQFDTGMFSGWASYTYAVTTRTQPDGYRFFPTQDRRHDVNLVSTWRWSGYALNMRFNVASGTPYTDIINAFNRHPYDPIQQSFFTYGSDATFLAGPRNAARLPLSHRLDLSVLAFGHLGGVAISPYLSIVNVYNAKNVFGYTFDYTRSPPTRLSLPQFPVLPTIGATLAW